MFKIISSRHLKFLFVIIMFFLISGTLFGCNENEPSGENVEKSSCNAEIFDEYINGNLPIPDSYDLSKRGMHINLVSFNEKNCAIAFDDMDAWMFDYELSKIVKLTDLDEMLTIADPTDRCREYFKNVTVAFDFHEHEDSIFINFKITSRDNNENSLWMNAWLQTAEKPYSHRGNLSVYSLREITYPGCEEPLSVKSIEELDKLYPDISPNEDYVNMIKAFIENDIPSLESQLALEKGTLTVWDGTVISDYTIKREMPLMARGFYSMDFTISKSTVDRYPAGKYNLSSSSRYIPGAYDIIRLDGEDTRYKIPDDADMDAINQALDWGGRHGGGMPADSQNPNEPGFAHVMLDYLMKIADQNGIDMTLFTGNMYREYAQKYLGFLNFDNEYTAHGNIPINHGGHGLNVRHVEVANYSYEDGIHYVTVNSFNDPFFSVVGQTHIYAMEETENEIYALRGTEFVYESGRRLMGWAV